MSWCSFYKMALLASSWNHFAVVSHLFSLSLLFSYCLKFRFLRLVTSVRLSAMNFFCCLFLSGLSECITCTYVLPNPWMQINHEFLSVSFLIIFHAPQAFILAPQISSNALKLRAIVGRY